MVPTIGISIRPATLLLAAVVQPFLCAQIVDTRPQLDAVTSAASFDIGPVVPGGQNRTFGLCYSDANGIEDKMR